jgi:ubiquitin-protein ligase
MSTVRLRRLHADYEKIQEYIKGHPRLQLIQVDGSPPERYQLEYRIRGLRQTADELSIVKSHMVEVSLPVTYPRLPPQCRMLTPIFHPNIAPHAICIGDHWSPGEPLWSIVARIGEMIAYQTYNTKSPLNGEAARWVDQHVDELPLDPVSMMPDDATVSSSGAATTRPNPPPTRAEMPPAQPGSTRGGHPTARPAEWPTRPAASAAPVPPPVGTEFACPQCGALLKLKPELAGKQVRCLRCKTVFRTPL